ncbi:MAG: pyruvate kinase [Planctomycetota bacterium]|nr:pyruvate kinase [Planctomycetota bacterium]
MSKTMTTPMSFINESRTKIVATVGPACRDEQELTNLVLAGVDVFRLNMAHAGPADQKIVVDMIRNVSKSVGRPIGILADLAGPKIRLGELPSDLYECREDTPVRFVRGSTITAPDELVTTYEPLIDELTVGNSVMLADGTVGLIVDEKGPDYVRCRVTQAGLVRSRQGVNLPGVKLSVPSMSDEDWQNAVWAAEVGIDFVSLSFVRTPVEVRLLKELLRTRGSKAKVVAKIEKQEALDQLEAIVDATDCIMVARGDLGVEIDVARMPMVQKQIVQLCNRYQKPVIVATQMLDSMQNNRRPTRAEVTDVANAILDGADACMLSGETAIGLYPKQAVDMMSRIAQATEDFYIGQPLSSKTERLAEGLLPITQAVVHGAGRIAQELGAKLIVAASRSGVTALALSKLRSFVPTIGVSDSETTLRQMCLYWGVTPLHTKPTKDSVQLLEQVSNWGVQDGRLKPGDSILLVAGTGLGTGGHNMCVVHEVN